MARGQEAAAQVTVVGIRNPLQINYRYAHRAQEFIANYKGPKDAVRALFQLVPLVPDVGTSPLKLTLEGATVNEPIALTSSLTAVIPMSQKAFDEDAVLMINRKADAYRIMFVATVALNDSGAYTAEYLSSACLQVFDFVRAQSFREKIRTVGKRCVGVRFLVPNTAPVAAPKIVTVTGESALNEVVSKLISYRAFDYRFSKTPAPATIVSSDNQIQFISAMIE